MEIKITKTTFIYICVSIIFCIGSFFAGRFIRFGRISGTSKQLIDGIIQAGNDTDKIIDQLVIAGASAESAANYGQIISGIVEELRTENEKLGVSTDAAIRAIESNKRISEIIQSANASLSSTTDNALELAIKRAEDYERLITTLQEALRDTTENNPKSE